MTFWRCAEDVLTRLVYLQCYVLKTSWRHLKDILNISWTLPENVFKTCSRHLQGVWKTSLRHLEDFWKMYDQSKYICLDQNVLKTSWRPHLKTYDQGKYIRLDQDILKTSWRRLLKTKINDVFKTSSRHFHQG